MSLTGAMPAFNGLTIGITPSPPAPPEIPTRPSAQTSDLFPWTDEMLYESAAGNYAAYAEDIPDLSMEGRQTPTETENM